MITGSIFVKRLDISGLKSLMQHGISLTQRRFYKYLLRLRPTILADFVKSIAGVKRVIVSSSEGKFYIDPVSSMGQAILDDEYEPSVKSLIKNCLKPGQIFIDVGANEGWYTIIASRLAGTEGRVIAIEPQNRLIAVIKENLRLNDCRNVTLIAAALNDGSANQAKIWLSPSTTTGSSSIVNPYFIARAQTTTCKTLSQVFDETTLDVAHFVKIDVEGFEVEVLNGALPLLITKRIRRLYVDFHTSTLNKRGIKVPEIHQTITSYGYNVENSNDQLSGYVLYIAN